VIKKRWWLPLAATLLLAVTSYYVVSLLPRVYEATTTLRVGQALESPNPSYQDFYISQQLAETYTNMASRRSILADAADSLGLGFVPSAKNIRARIVPNTQFLEISVRDRDPVRSRIIADAIAQQLVLQSPGALVEEQAQQAFLQAQLQEVQQDIQAIRVSVQEGRESRWCPSAASSRQRRIMTETGRYRLAPNRLARATAFSSEEVP
jgi:uncharacterized protein involved in exopolysaccharide biosynthesis